MDERDKQNLLVAIVVIALIAVSLWLIHQQSEIARMQNCVFSGRRNCHPIAADPQD